MGKSVMVMDVPGKRRKRRPKRRWIDSVKHNMTEKEFAYKNSNYPATFSKLKVAPISTPPVTMKRSFD